MPCPSVTTGQGFLVETLSHLDCQAQVIGSYGFQSLADSASPTTTVLSALLTLFIAIFGIRLLFGGRVGTEDAVGGVLKIGIVLTLALSWPAYRTLAYDTVLHGPAEIAASIGGSTLPDMSGGLPQRLQAVDDNMVAYTEVGSGRLSGALDVPGEETGTFRGVAMTDETGLGFGRTVFLASTIGSLATLRIAAGLLLAIAPLVAGLLLFDVTRGVFAGWLRGLALTALGSLGISLLLGVQVAVMEPWIVDALNRRTLGYATPAAPTELLALSLAFALASFGLLALLARVAFQNSWHGSSWFRGHEQTGERVAREGRLSLARPDMETQTRALAVSEGVRTTMRFETHQSNSQSERRVTEVTTRDRGDGPVASQYGSAQPLGSSYRRNTQRRLGSQQNRDARL